MIVFLQPATNLQLIYYISVKCMTHKLLWPTGMNWLLFSKSHTFHLEGATVYTQSSACKILCKVLAWALQLSSYDSAIEKMLILFFNPMATHCTIGWDYMILISVEALISQKKHVTFLGYCTMLYWLRFGYPLEQWSPRQRLQHPTTM